MLMLVTVAEAPLPAASVALPVADWPAPSPLSACGAVHDATPERASVQVKLTVTVPLFQPFALAAGNGLPVMPGAVRSILTVPEADALALPATSVQVPDAV